MKSDGFDRGASDSWRREAPGPVWSLCCLAVYSLIAPDDAYAYLDPGTGSLILQLIAGAVLGASLTVKMWWFRVKALFSRIRTGSRSNTEDIEDGDG